MCTLGRPPGNTSSAVTKFAKFCANTVCLSWVEAELSITNRMSTSASTGIVLVIAPVWTGTIFDTLRSGQPPSTRLVPAATSKWYGRIDR